MNCLPFLPCFSSDIWGPCYPWCFNFLTCGFHHFSLVIMMVLTPINLDIYLVCLSIWFCFSSVRFVYCSCLCDFCATDFLLSVELLFQSTIEDLVKESCVYLIFWMPIWVFFLVIKSGIRYFSLYIIQFYWWNWLSISVQVFLIWDFVYKLTIILSFIFRNLFLFSRKKVYHIDKCIFHAQSKNFFHCLSIYPFLFFLI